MGRNKVNNTQDILCHTYDLTGLTLSSNAAFSTIPSNVVHGPAVLASAGSSSETHDFGQYIRPTEPEFPF